MTDGDRSLAIFIDFENLALGFQGRRDRFDIERVLARLVEKGKVVAKKAYADWSRFKEYTAPLHESAIELIEIPKRSQTGKNSADIRLCVDAMDLAYSKEHIDTFVVVSGDSDFSPLVSKLKENGKHVIGLGMQESTSELLRDNCDEFIYYEDLNKSPTLAPTIPSTLPEQKRKAFALLLESLLALRRENKTILWSSMVKDTMKRKKPSFNEAYHGYRTFSELLLDAQKESLVDLDVDARSRTYVVTRFGAEMSAPVPVSSSEVRKRRRRVRPRKRMLNVNDESAPGDAETPRDLPAPERDPHAERPRDDDIPF
ncbi:MAG: NYN domain-containing protein [Gemmataceae bacterium]|nr:NYN domain-containing protein [Gemmataceae bacterium]